MKAIRTLHRKRLQLLRGRLALEMQHFTALSPGLIHQIVSRLRKNRAVPPGGALTLGFPVSAFRRQLWHIKNKNSKKCELELRDIYLSKDKGVCLGAQLGPDQLHRPALFNIANEH